MPSSILALKTLKKINQFSVKQALYLIQQALLVKNSDLTFISPNPSKLVALVFLEPSTRTRFSFETACKRLQVSPIVFSADGTTSTVKGESLHETLNTILAMKPDALILRSPANKRIEAIVDQINIPYINAGYGVEEHPTQALLDAMTIFEKRGQIKNERILFVGDVEHSRVANSTAQLVTLLGGEIAYCVPQEFLPRSPIWKSAKNISSINEAMSWATVCIGLRAQKERHSDISKSYSVDKYIENYRVDLKNIKNLSKEAIIMHPGPFVPELDLSEEIFTDPRCAIHEQVTNGVFMRMTILGELLGLSRT